MKDPRHNIPSVLCRYSGSSFVINFFRIAIVPYCTVILLFVKYFEVSLIEPLLN